MNLTSLSLWLLCDLAAVALLCARPAGVLGPLQWLVGVGCGAWLSGYGVLSGAAVASCIGLYCGWQLLGSPRPALGRVAAGVATGCAAAVHRGMGLDWWLALTLAAVVPVLMLVRAWSTDRSPRSLQEQALCGLTLAAPAVACAPLLAAGWQSAGTLNRAVAAAVVSPPQWTWQLVLLAAMAGIVRAAWERR